MNGFKMAEGAVRGGISRLWLAKAESVESVVVASGRCEKVILSDGAAFAEYEIFERQGLYSEKAGYKNGLVKLTHRLSFAVPFSEAAGGSVAEILATASDQGVVALLLTAAGEKLLVGYSVEFGAGFPLKLDSAESGTGKDQKAIPATSIVLKCESVSPALSYTGALP